MNGDSPREESPREGRFRWLIALGAFGLVLIGGGLWYALQREEPVVVAPASEAVIQGTRTIDLFFPGPEGEILRESREIVGSEFLEDDVRRAVEELIRGGTAGIRPVPSSTRLLNVFYDGTGEITLNFTDHLRTDHPGGSEAELATLRCLVSTVGSNFPGVDQVRLLIEGDEAVTLAGHTDLRDPLRVADYR